MEGYATGKNFKMKGHTLPGINQREGHPKVAAKGLAASSPFQDDPHKTTPEHPAHKLENTETTNKDAEYKAFLAKAKRQREAQIVRRMSKYNVSREQSITRQEEIEGMTREEKDAAHIM